MTVDEVNALIPELHAIFLRIVQLRREITARANELERLGFDPTAKSIRGLPPDARRTRERLDASVTAFEGEIDRIGALGGILQDLDLGLVDFTHELAGDTVLLCWQFGEDQVTHFHPMGAGFSARNR